MKRSIADASNARRLSVGVSLVFLMALAPVRALAQVPAAPANMQADVSAVTGHITITWDNPNDNTIINYEYRARAKQDNPIHWRPDWTEYTGSDANTVGLAVTNVGEGTTLVFHLKACNTHGCGSDSFVEATVNGNPSTPPILPPVIPPPPVITPPPSLAGAPTNLKADFKNSTYGNLVMTMTWAPPFTGVDNVTGYEFKIYEGGPTSRVFPPVVDWTGIPEDSVANLRTGHSIGYNSDVSQYTLHIASVVDGKRQEWAQAGVYVPDRIKSVVLSDESSGLPDRVVLGQNYPNPFNPSTRIEYTVLAPSHVRISVWDMKGREIGVLVDEVKTVGGHEAIFDARDLPSGLYIYRMETAAGILSKTMILLK